ncbi:MAG: DUF4062 domain-containing protein [Flavobacteriales bacterium]|nr:DUF4062 domain-containing protein [Flavobacteriales bacterium]MBK7942224.1 DUF4062 domain-containing protein [Flavobacteriales bacterium]MBK9701860.1 DUF4062 domain-containing protein [Flavobacteriales bacterium]
MSAKKRSTRAATPKAKPKVLVSSSVYGQENLLEAIYADLEGYGYEVLMSHRGTVPVDPQVSAMDSCLKAVEECDLFLGIIFPRYGSGKEKKDDLSITHREAIRAIERGIPRWFLVHEHVALARQLLDQYRNTDVEDHFALKAGMTYRSTTLLSDLKVIDLYELAMRHDITEVGKRKGNWVQPYAEPEDARLFVNAQFRRYREVLQKHLPKLSSEEVMKRLKK